MKLLWNLNAPNVKATGKLDQNHIIIKNDDNIKMYKEVSESITNINK